MHIAFHNCNQFVFLERKKKKVKERHMEARDLFGLGKSLCFVWVYNWQITKYWNCKWLNTVIARF